MRKLSFLALPLIVAIVVPLNADTVVEEIIARVNNQIITAANISAAKNRPGRKHSSRTPANADKVYAEHEKDVLRGLIDQQFLLERGKDMEITGDTEVIKRLDEMRKQMNLATIG